MNAFPNSVVQVATSVPAFIGYTQMASHAGMSLDKKPWRIGSMAEFEACFGAAPIPSFSFDVAHTTEESDFEAVALQGTSPCTNPRQNTQYKLKRTKGTQLLYHSMQLFFQNGGGTCYIVSVGDYVTRPSLDALTLGMEQLLREQEPTMLVIPEAMLLDAADCYALQQQMLMHCGFETKNRFALLDIHCGQDLDSQPIEMFRNNVNSSFLAFGAAYYPWLNTNIVALEEINLGHLELEQQGKFKEMLEHELATVLLAETTANPSAARRAEQICSAIEKLSTDWSVDSNGDAQITEMHDTLLTLCPLYGRVLKAAQRNLNLLPPAAAMAGVFTMVDTRRGVWKAPANVALAAVTSPALNITHEEQERLNASTCGKSINAIRSFIGEGILVWGARTLDGNSQDWRYINVRRTMIMIEESLRLASQAYVFEPNTANTWVTIKSMASNFLTNVWKGGGLAGATPNDACSVAVGLNETMTADDILEGVLRVTILVALTRPAEFIEITFQQQMQKT